MKMMALIAVAILTGCGTDPARTMHAVSEREAEALAAHRLTANSLPEMKLLATQDGRDAVSQVVSCALPRGASITAISEDGTPYWFTGNSGLAPAWAHRTPTASEQYRVIACMRAHMAGLIRT